MTLRHEPDPSVGAWIRPRLGPFGARVGSLVPRGYPAYARVLHRVEVVEHAVPPPGRLVPDPADAVVRHVRWADVATAHGTIAHPTVQYWRLARSPDPWSDPADWPQARPEEGNLDAEQAGPLLDVLGRHTERGAEVVAGFWDGYGWMHPGSGSSWSWAVLTDDGDPAARADTVARARAAAQAAQEAEERRVGAVLTPEVLAAPRLELPHREYLLFRGPLDDVLPFCANLQPHRVQRPNLLWAADGSWCAATEIDLDSTVVGGSVELVADVLAHPDLEALPLAEDDSLMSDGDALNP